MRDSLERLAELDREVRKRSLAMVPLDPQVEAERPKPISSDDRSKNALRPNTFDEIIGQDKAKKMMTRMCDAAKISGRLDHCLLVGPAGTGKTTFSNVIANTLGSDCYQIAAPVSLETLMELREVMQDGDILLVDEIHMQAAQERRGKTASTAPEVFLQLLEDSVIATPEGMLEYPRITVIGATTDEGMLPDPFIARFPLRPRLEKYSVVDLGEMAVWNAAKLGYRIQIEAAHAFARAARFTPREVNNYMKNAVSLCGPDKIIKLDLAHEVLYDLNGVTPDGLTPDQQAMLVFLYTRARRIRRARTATDRDEVTYQASVTTIATAIGKSRDAKAIQLRVEPYLIDLGLIQVGHGGRILTDAGIARAAELATSVSG